MNISRRSFMRSAAGAAFGAPLLAKLFEREAGATPPRAKRVIFYYFPDGVPAVSQNGDPSLWHCEGSETMFTLSSVLAGLERHKADCLFFNGLSMGPTDAGSHPGGAKKLLTAVDGGNGESIDQYLARTAGSGAPFRHVYLGAMANADNASGDKLISYPSAGVTVAPEDDPTLAFQRLFGAGVPSGNPSPTPMRDPKATVIDAIIGDLDTLRMRLGNTEKRKLDLHMEALREVEARIKAPMTGGSQNTGTACPPGQPTLAPGALVSPEHFPEILRLQMDVMVQAMACGLTQVGTLQASHHTSDLIMSRFPGTDMFDPNFDMRSHQASHYGAAHDFNHREFRDYVAQCRWWVDQFAYLLDQLKAVPEDGGTMLDHSIVVLCSEVCDGNTHLHDNMPFILAGRAGGRINSGRLLQYEYQRHANLYLSIAHALGETLSSFGDASSGPLSGVLA